MRKKLSRLQVRLARFRRIRLPRHVRRAKTISRQPRAVPFITFSFLFILTAGLYILAIQTNTLPKTLDTKLVIISHDHVQEAVPTHEKTVAGLLTKLGIQLNQGDVVEPSLTTVIDQDQFRINIYRAVPVEIIDGNIKTFTFSAATTPRSIAVQTGDKVYPEDTITAVPNQNFLLSAAIGEQIVIDRATLVNVDLYGTPVVLRTHATTIAGLIAEKGIKLINSDQIVPAADTPITSGQQIAFIRTGVKVETVTETIAMPVETTLDNSLAYGTSAVRQQGSSGQQIVTYQIQLQNNIETGRTAIQKLITKPTVTQKVVIGTSLSGIKGDIALAGIDVSVNYDHINFIFTKESTWNPAAENYLGCIGLGQACPGGGKPVLIAQCPNWQSDPVCQIKFFNNYAIVRYGSWANAEEFWRAPEHHWW